MVSSFSRLAVAAAALLAAGSTASACQTSDLAGNWVAVFGPASQDLCRLTLGADGVVGSSACWHEVRTPKATWGVAGTLVLDPSTCMITSKLTATTPSTTTAADPSRRRAGAVTVSLEGRLLTGNEVVLGLLTRADGHFGPLVMTRVP